MKDNRCFEVKSLLLFYFTIDFNASIAGVIFLILAGITNLVIFTLLLFSLFVNEKTQNIKTLKTMGLMSLNIPIVFVYIYFSLVIFNTVRITIENKTGEDLTEIMISGCENKLIGELSSNSRKTVWINISKGCPIIIEYNLRGGETYEEVLFYYLSRWSGQKAKYRIGIDNLPIDDTI